MRPGTNWPVCPPEPTAAPPIPSPAPSTPYPHAGGSLQWPPGGAGLLCTPPYQSPREGGPLRPPTPSRSANWRICKIAISSAPSRVFTDPPFQSPGSLSPGKVPPPRACTPRLAPRARPPASRAGFASTSPPPPHPPVRPTPPPRQLAPHAPGLGGGTAGGARLRGDRRAGGRTARVTLPGTPP
ncbi:hypothetical protein N7524_008857 [Penicillium chrysogenum]|nr:hypothetical protein N7524_008857 [Penicillium chrysogenum]